MQEYDTLTRGSANNNKKNRSEHYVISCPPYRFLPFITSFRNWLPSTPIINMTFNIIVSLVNIAQTLA